MGLTNRPAAASLILGRVVYSINWFNLAAVFFAASELNQNVTGLGLVTSSFYIGVGVFQIPAGVLAARIGPRLTAIYGTTCASLAVLLTAVAGNLTELAILRFFVGVGMAFVFAPGIILITRCLRKGSEGFGVGIYSSAFNLGGAIGLSGWAVLAVITGWRMSLAISGLLGLFTSGLLIFTIPKDKQNSDFRLDLTHLKLALLDKRLILLSVTLLAFGVGNAIIGNFIVYYLESIGLSPGIAGAMGSVYLLLGLAIAPLSGKLFDRVRDVRVLILVSGVLTSLSLGVAFLGTTAAVVFAVIVNGLAVGAGMTFVYSAARTIKKASPEYDTLSVSMVNSVSLFCSFLPLIFFSNIAYVSGYPFAWLCSAVLTLVLIAPMLLDVSKTKLALRR